MSKTRSCPICKSTANAEVTSYHSGKFHTDGVTEIVVDGVEVYQCSNEECNHRWLPIDQERKIDQTIAKLSRFDLQPLEVQMIRESLPFDNKFQTANFLCLNEKAFTKWELGYSEPNRAYDLLLRLSAHSRDNFNFVKHLHETNFKFDPQDYELICNKHNMKWNFNVLQNPSFKVGTGSVVITTQVVQPRREWDVDILVGLNKSIKAEINVAATQGYTDEEVERAQAS